MRQPLLKRGQKANLFALPPLLRELRQLTPMSVQQIKEGPASLDSQEVSTAG